MKAMMMFICMLLVQGMAMANNRINGRVVDDSDASPLIGATVVLSDEAGKQVMGVTTDTNGCFELKEVMTGDYTLQCSYIGYDTFTLVLKQLERNMDLGEIRLKPASEVLDEVVIEGEKVIQKIDRQLVISRNSAHNRKSNMISMAS